MNEKTFFILAHSFQGIDHLDFRPDKFGNQDIVGMVSAQVTLGSKEGKEGKGKALQPLPFVQPLFFKINLSFLTNNQEYQDEVVTFTSTIYPIDAKGMVEKWLLQVEIQNKKILTKTSQTRISITTKHRLRNRWCAH